MATIRILIVDDDTVDRLAAERALQRASIGAELSVVSVASAEEAFEVVGNEPLDAVLLDLNLPGATGVEVVATLRARDPFLPVIMLTGQGDEQTAVDAMKAGATDYLTKAALEPKRLAQSILRGFRMRDVERASEATRKQLVGAEERYRFLADSILQMVWVISDDGRLEYVNRQWVEYCGVPPGAAEAEMWAIIHPEDRESFRARWDDATSSNGRFEVLARVRRRFDGVYRWHLHRAEGLRANDGILRWFGTSTDIEEQKRTEAELLRLKEIAEQERLRAEESNRAKDEFLAVLSHELRTPLNSILGWVQLLRAAGATPESLDRGLATIDRSARTQTQLIEDLLDVSRIIAGKLVIERRPVDLRELIFSAMEMLRPLAAAKKVSLHPDIGADTAVVLGDSARLQQVIWNLLVNAVKFNRPGGTVSVETVIDAVEVHIRVVDGGAGIAPNLLPHVFERFRQGDSSFTRSHGGLGLGLSIAQHIVGLHGGRIQASSDGVGTGATFVVSLHIEGAETLPRARSLPPQKELSLKDVNVLVVDDDDDSREVLVVSLERYGAVVRSASSVAMAREKLAEQLPDVVVSDLGMPQEDGFELIAHIRSLPSGGGRELLVIALTGFAGLEDERRARSAGFDQHISKPVDANALPRVIARLLATRNVS